MFIILRIVPYRCSFRTNLKALPRILEISGFKVKLSELCPYIRFLTKLSGHDFENLFGLLVLIFAQRVGGGHALVHVVLVVAFERLFQNLSNDIIDNLKHHTDLFLKSLLGWLFER